MRKLIAYFIKYPVSVNVIIIAFVLLGWMGYNQLNSSFFPLMDSEQIAIAVSYPGASPQEMEEGVVLKIEDNLKGLVGIGRVTSTSSENTASIQVELARGFDIDLILADVKNAVDKVPNFPTGMEPPVIAKLEEVRSSISFVVTGEGVSLNSLKQITQKMESDLRRLDQVSQITISGYPEEEIEIAVREQDLRAYGVTFQQIANAVSKTNILTSGGTVKTKAEEYLIRARNRVYYGDELSNIVVKALPNGAIVRLKDVASVRDVFSESPNRTYFNGDLAIRVDIANTNDEDLIGAADQVKGYIKIFNAKNDNLQINISSDRSVPLRQRTELLFKSAWQGMLLVLLFLSLFLRPSLAFWVAAGLPVAFFGMFMFAGFFNVTINVLSLFGMIIVIGILVDDGIVISENIYHHYEQGKNKVQAAIDGTIEVIPPILSAISTTVLAFSIFFFLDGRFGKFFAEIAVIVALTLIVSLIEALIILPAHIAHSRALDKKQKVYKINIYAEKLMDFMRDKLYVPALKFCLRYRILALSIPVALFILTMGAIQSGIIRMTFFPTQASDRISINLNMPQGTNEKVTDSLISYIEAKTIIALQKIDKEFDYGIPIMENITKRIGPGSSKASLRVNLITNDNRLGSKDINKRIRAEVGEIPSSESLSFNSGGNFGGSPVAVSLLSNNLSELKAAKSELKKVLSQNSELKDISDNDPRGIKEIRIALKDNAYLLGLTLNDVMSQVRSGFFGLQVQRFQRGDEEIKVWIRYDRKERESIKNLDDMRIVTPTGQRVSFSEIASYNMQRGEISISHIDGQRQILISADVKDKKTSSAGIVADIRKNIMPELQAKYPSITALYEGQNREASKTIDSLPFIGSIVGLLIYIVIAFTFRSYGQPLMLIVMVPFSLIGIAWGHYIHGFALNVLSMLGIIALVGIMVNDGLVLISKFNAYLKEGMNYQKALYQAGRSRFRAIFLTTITTVAGLVPLLFETSRQAQFLKPMAIAIIYGIIIATFLTLLVLPILLTFSNDIKVYSSYVYWGKKPKRESVERAIKERQSEELASDSMQTTNKQLKGKVLPMVLLILLGSTAVFSQELLTKKEAVSLVMQNNYDILLSENTKAIAKNNTSIYNSGNLPSLVGQLGGDYNLSDSENKFPDSNQNGSITGAESETYSASLGVNYLLFNGFARKYSNEKLKETYNLSTLQADMVLENTLLTLFTAYYEVARLMEETDNKRSSLTISNERLLRANYNFDYGQNTKLEVLNATVDRNADSISFVESNRLLKNAKRDLNLVLAREVDTDMKVDTTVQYASGLDKNRLLENTLITNRSIQQATKNIALSDYDIRISKGGYMPNVSLTGSYAWTKGVNDATTPFRPIEQINKGLSAGISLSWNVFDGGQTKTAVQNAKLAKESNEIQLNQLQQTLIRDFNNAWETYQNNLFVLDIQKTNVATSRLNFERSAERYKMGQINAIDFRQAQQNLLNVDLSLSQAKYATKLSELRVLQLAGLLLEEDHKYGGE